MVLEQPVPGSLKFHPNNASTDKSKNTEIRYFNFDFKTYITPLHYVVVLHDHPIMYEMTILTVKSLNLSKIGAVARAQE